MSYRQKHTIVRTLYPLLVVALVLAASISAAPQSVAQSPAGVWMPTGSMNLPRSGHTATLLSNGQVLVAGGKSGEATYHSSAELYDPATGTWSLTGSMGASRSGHTATLLPDGRVLVAGGWNGTEQLSSADLYDPAAGTWTSTGGMSAARSGHTATLLNYVPLWKYIDAGDLGMSNPTWEAPHYYRTIQTADIDGDGAAELLARRYDGLHTYHFNTGTTKWEEVPAGNLGMSGASWEQEYYYGTIQTADVDGDGAAELLARRSVGLFVYKFNTGTQMWEDVDAGNLGMSSPTWQAPHYYRTIQTADIDGDGAAELLARRYDGLHAYRFNTGTTKWEEVPAGNLGMSGASWEQEYYYGTIQTGDVDGDGAAELLARRSVGLFVYKFNTGTQMWEDVDAGNLGMSSPTWQAPHYYRTIQTADIDGDGAAELLARRYDGLHTYRFNTGTTKWEEVPAGNLGMSGASWEQEYYYGTIQTGDVDGDGAAELLARRSVGLFTYRFNTGTEMWEGVPAGNLGMSGTAWEQEYHYGTIQTGDIDGDGAAELLARRSVGMAAYRWSGVHRVLIAGGYADGTKFNSAELYDPATGTWSATDSMSDARSGHTATPLPAGKVLVAGGDGASTLLSSAELYDPVTRTWSPTGGMGDARTDHTATRLSDGRVLAIAGRIAPIIPWNRTELYSPVTGTWSSAADINIARIWFHTANLLPSGHVLLAGGIGGDPSDHLSGAELYDPVTDAWALTASMSTSCSGHTATLLPDGRVLVAGGRNNTGELSSAALFEPATRIFLPLAVRNAWPSRAATRR